MGELANCPKCGGIFVKNQFRDICQNCWKEEEKAYETVYRFIRKRENRAATIQQVVEATGVEEELLFKFIRTGRLILTQFPNLGYPCDKCGKIIREGKLCNHCKEELRKELELHEAEEERKREIEKREKQATYLAMDARYRKREF
ncbi:TIGR03826 family flagellar region protein [Bacillus methanolicus]|uniref:Membrane protein n=1 Tax=Bacillus methanolicus (strain MGA3 / ATCC 53907) TaxID=796606 RepID=I3EB05_BACMM|nr:TIGR03826 family flagellar region protein [Bacillus methanolicus]AIE61360.1 membrane protein [Bacillus methanolicus MGA3]EIJ83676.1 membrane protein [Bacillus methanolicus MGA3]